ncbi:hypothetical protein YYC_04798 [Plasmodium yoelii 17X]|uniref:Uncharacterized protein n=1 Tax=Plasmodium yoelii 17X TaxID=1323249 RepID=V7PF30_PLAYE|nr:hypothetical protein YYC_04798 [Plasmodium yoelii 17X]
MNNPESLENIYINLNNKRAKISYLSPLKVKHNNLIKHSFLLYFKITINSYLYSTFKGLFKLINSLINTGSVLIV